MATAVRRRAPGPVVPPDCKVHPDPLMPVSASIRRPLGALSEKLSKAHAVIVTTTPSVEGKRITAYHGVVVGEAILGANVFRDVFAGITDILGGRSSAYEESLSEARETAIREMSERALQVGGNAVVGVDLDYEVINNMLMVSSSGTAVSLD